MNTIFRTFNKGLILASILAVGAVAGRAQDPCTDATGQAALYDTFLEKFKDKTVTGYKARVELGKQYVEKYGSCEATKTNTDYFKTNVPKWEQSVKEMEGAAVKNALVARFDNALKTKNFDEVYSSGKEILQKYPEEFRTAEIVLAAVGGEEAFKANNKYNADALMYIKQSLADLEANKSFVLGDKPRYGLSLVNVYNYEYRDRDDAIAWLNLYAGYINAVGQKNKAAALPYLYKTSQVSSSEASKNSVVYELIGSYYFDELNKLVEEIKKLQEQQNAPGITEDALKALVDQIKAKVAMTNGTAERAMDAYARAYSFAKDPAIKAKMKKNVEDAYRLRKGNLEGVDAFIASTITKPFVNPATPIAPISDAEPATTTSGATGPAASPTTAAPQPAVTVPAKAPATTAPPTKPATKSTGTKPGKATLKTVAKKKA